MELPSLFSQATAAQRKQAAEKAAKKAAEKAAKTAAQEAAAQKRKEEAVEKAKKESSTCLPVWGAEEEVQNAEREIIAER